jgi:hypothetical protein
MGTVQRIAAIALTAAAATTAIGGSTDASGGRGWTTIRFRGTDTGGTVQYSDPICDQSGNCVYVTHASGGQLGGDLDGTEVGTGLTTVATTGVAVIQQSAVFTGTVRGCGTGTVVYTNHGEAMPGEAIFRWRLEIEPGTGTGDLTGMTGTAVGQLDTTDPAGVAIATGVFRCRRHA